MSRELWLEEEKIVFDSGRLRRLVSFMGRELYRLH